MKHIPKCAQPRCKRCGKKAIGFYQKLNGATHYRCANCKKYNPGGDWIEYRR